MTPPPDTASEGLSGLLAPGAAPERLADLATWGEGPLWLPDDRRVIWSDIPANRILSWTEREGATVWRTDVEFTNGRALDREGRVVACSHGRRAIERGTGDGEPVTVVDTWRDRRLNSPNDVIVDSAGAIWFTDPPYGIVQPHEGHPGRREYGDNHVFRLDAGATEPVPVVIDVEEPNGLALSPDESVLYVADTSAALRADGGGNRLIRAYDVIDGHCKNGRVFARMDRGLADGLRVDVDGNVWTSHGPSVTVIDPGGAWLGTVEVPETVANLCFGGPDGTDLFIAATTGLYRLRTRTRGATP